MEPSRIVDADCHILEPPDIWEHWLPERHQDRAPKLVKDPEGGDAWLTAVEKLPRATFVLRSPERGGGDLTFTRDPRNKLTIAHATAGRTITYAAIADRLETLARRTITLHITGRAPTKRERIRLAPFLASG